MKKNRPLWIAAAIVALFVPIFVGLGAWQLQRADQKQALQQEYDRRSSEAPLKLGAQPHTAEELRYRRLTVRGRYDPDYQILIDNRVHRGVVGYFVLTPLRIEGSDTRVLVNRGWVSIGAGRQHLPEVTPPSGVQDIAGVATLPIERAFTLGDAVPEGRGWHPVWQFVDMKRYVDSVPFLAQPVVVLLDAHVAGGYVREWPRLDTGIALHHGYAVQWFALAALAAVITGLLIRRSLPPRSRGRK
ncbi:MAG TPA: SURF1 family protein [Burkholderiales bacterium]|nr:SURF1 family protein [Burkholderiales bacterium]